MEYIYAGMLIHRCGGTINEETVKKVITDAGGKVDNSKVKALVAAMQNVDIDKAIKEAAVPIAAPAARGVGEEAKKEEKKEEERVDTEKAAAGLGALFG